MYFTIPPLVAATVDSAGVQALTPGRFSVRIGDVPMPGFRLGVDGGASYVEGSLTIVGEGPKTLFSLPRPL
jgi:hypothetical protein